MASKKPRSPFEQLRDYYDHERFVCRDCGFEDEDGKWNVETDGTTVVYNHSCPQCGKNREYRVTLSDSDTAGTDVEE